MIQMHQYTHVDNIVEKNGEKWNNMENNSYFCP